MRNTQAIIAPNRRMVSGSAILANAAMLKPTAKQAWGTVPKHIAHSLIATRAQEARAEIVAQARARCAAFKPRGAFVSKVTA